MQYKVIITNSQTEINNELSSGWKIESITAQHVATGGTATSFGNFLIVLRKS